MAKHGGRIIAKRREAIFDEFVTFFSASRAGDKVECPDQRLYNIYSQMTRWNKLPFQGGLLDQPFMLMLELMAVDEAYEACERMQSNFQKSLAG